MEQCAINCKFLYVSIISTNNSQCRFFTVYEVQLTLMYFIFRVYGSYECHALTFLSSFYLMLLYILYFVIRDSNSNNKNIKAQKNRRTIKKKLPNYKKTTELYTIVMQQPSESFAIGLSSRLPPFNGTPNEITFI